MDANGELTTFRYDALNRLTGVINPKLEETSYTYNMLGDVTTLTYPDQNTLEKQYDELSRLIKRTDPIR